MLYFVSGLLFPIQKSSVLVQLWILLYFVLPALFSLSLISSLPLLLRRMIDVDLDVDLFLKDLESVLIRPGFKGSGSDVDLEEGSSSDMDFGNFWN